MGYQNMNRIEIVIFVWVGGVNLKAEIIEWLFLLARMVVNSI